MKLWNSVLLSVVMSLVASGQTVNSTDRAKKLFERLTSIKIAATDPRLAQMANLISEKKIIEAAKIATSDPSFLNLTVKQMSLKLSTREETIQPDFNDFSAAFIGITRDQRDARELLTGNFYYMGDSNQLSGQNIPSDLATDFLNSNNHYKALDNGIIDIGKVLIRVSGQKIIGNNNTVIDNPDPAGVLTSRSWISSHAIAGTNRRNIEFTFREFLCLPIEEWADTGASDIRIGRDIDRFPGGDHNKFQTSCKGCHTGMDGFRGAFAFWDFQNNRAVNTMALNPTRTPASNVTQKMNQNNTVFPSGFVSVDNSFVNNTLRPNGANVALIGWRGDNISNGNGVSQFGKLIANSKRFSQCLSLKVYESVCRKKIKASLNKDMLEEFGNKFEQSQYNILNLYHVVSTDSRCSG